MSFDSLLLHPLICKSVADAGYTTPTAIQEKAIPVALAGRDVLASAQTGTGKTAAFILPILQKLSVPSTVTKSRGARALILTPTRELAQQVTDCARRYGQYFESLAVVSVVGGVPYERQRRKFGKNIDILVATPGRLADYMRQGEIDFRRIEVLVLDEADRMLDMGFREEVVKIAEAQPKNRQTLLFSATIDSTIEKIAQRLLRNPERIEITPQKTKHESIDQKLHYVADLGEKKRVLIHILHNSAIGQAIIFTATKRSADQLTYQLRDEGFAVSALHGDLRQRQRTRTIGELQDGELQFLVATDLAARGIDVRTVSHIINFDLPRGSEDYVHRIGRTGRAGEKGTAISIAYHYEKNQVRRIESFVGHRIAVEATPRIESDSKVETQGKTQRVEGARETRGENAPRAPQHERRENSQRPSRHQRFHRNKKSGFRRGRDARQQAPRFAAQP